GGDLDALGYAVERPPEQLPPERFVGLIVDRNAGVHLPEPGVLHAEQRHIAAAVALDREQWLLRATLDGPPREQHRRAGLELAEAIHRSEWGQRVPMPHRRLGSAEL